MFQSQYCWLILGIGTKSIREYKVVKIILTLVVRNVFRYNNEESGFVIMLKHFFTCCRINPACLDLCKLGEKKLGLIILAAAKGLITFLKQSRSLFGSNILNCHDYNNITPLYLAQIYNQTIVIQWMKGI
jgi:hypothetical protein